MADKITNDEGPKKDEPRKEEVKGEEPKKEESWWLALIGGIALVGGAVWVYIDLTAFEAEGGQRRMQWIIALIYKWLGKWGIVIFMVVGGLGAILYGISQLWSKLSSGDEEPPPRKKKKRQRIEDDDE